MRSRANEKSSLLTQIGSVRKELASLSTVLEADSENNEMEVVEDVGREDKLLEEKERVERELRRFSEEELELVKAGGDPLLTCKHCHYLFMSYRGYEKHNCHHILQPEDGEVEHYQVLEGGDRAEFLRCVDRLSIYKKIQICISTKKAVKGIYPLIFPAKHDVSTARFEEVGCSGEAAYSALRQALREHALHLPRKLVLDLPLGGELYLPPSFLTPRPRCAGWRSKIEVLEDVGTNWLFVKAVVDPSTPLSKSEQEEEEAECVPDIFCKEDSEDEDDDELLEQLGGGPGEVDAGGVGAGVGGAAGGAARPSGAVGTGGAGITLEERRVSPDYLILI